MPQVNYAEDIVPLSSFRADVTRLMAQTRQTHRPIVVTQNGRAANVFLDVGDYQKLIDKLDLMMDIYKGEQDIAAGRVHSTDEVRRAIAADLGVSVDGYGQVVRLCDGSREGTGSVYCRTIVFS